MISPAEQKIIQIDITNACIHQCSNCTRFCGHHPKPFFMCREDFEGAVDSLKEYSGMVGVMGGEPTIHPEFDGFVRHLACAIPENDDAISGAGLAPIRDFALHKALHLSDIKHRRGLWTSLGKGYRKHYELIQDTFGYQCINDHSNPGLHQALLISRKELGISDEEWIPLRDTCWVQRLWSASITPKGAFFCEVAGALDMLFDGPGGWAVEPGWWRRTPDQFGDQLQWCEFCSAALRVPSRRANEETDDVSPELYEKLRALGSPKLRRGKVDVYRPGSESTRLATVVGPESYLPKEDHRGRIGKERERMETHVQIVARLSGGLQVRSEDGAWEKHEVLKWTAKHEWILLCGEWTDMSKRLEERLASWILNPGCVYCLPSSEMPEIVLFHPAADSLKRITCFEAPLALAEVAALWPESNRQILNLDDEHWDGLNREYEATLTRSQEMMRFWVDLWNGLGQVRIGLFGGGAHTEWLLALINARGLLEPVAILDDAPKVGSIYGVPVVRSTDWTMQSCALDVIVVSSDTIPQFLAARAEAVAGSRVRIVNPYEGNPEPTFQKLWNFV